MSDRFEPGADDGSIAISVGGREVSYAEFNALIENFRSPSAAVLEPAGLDVVSTLVAVFAAARSGFAVLLGTPDASLPGLPALPADSFLVVLTSGTSGRQRVVVRTVDSWFASFRPFAEVTGLTSQDVVLLTGPVQSTLHLFAAVHTLWLGARLTDDPAAASAVHAVPAVLSDLLADPPGWLRTAVVAGAPLPAALEDRAAELGLKLVEYYGAAELSFVGVRVCPGRLRPFPRVRIRVIDGVLWAASPYLASSRFALSPGGPALDELGIVDGFASAGDLGLIAADGSLTVRGRGDQAVTTGGHTVIVEDVERVIAALPGVVAVTVVGTPQARLGQVLTAVVELVAGTELESVRRAARSRLSGPALPRRWSVVDALPRTGSGKVARGLVASRLTDDSPGLSPVDAGLSPVDAGRMNRE